MGRMEMLFERHSRGQHKICRMEELERGRGQTGLEIGWAEPSQDIGGDYLAGLGVDLV